MILRLTSLILCMLFPFLLSAIGKVKERHIESMLCALYLDSFTKLTPKQGKWLEEQTCSVRELKKNIRNKKRLKEELLQVKKIGERLSTKPLARRIAIPGIKKPIYPFSIDEVVCPRQRYLVSSSPRSDSLSLFWQAIVNNNVSLIVTLVSPFEENKEYCTSFWNQEYFPLLADNWAIRPVAQKALTKKKSPEKPGQLILRSFVATNPITGESRSIKQIHYLNWPDLKRPNLSLLQQCISLAIQLNPDRNQPILVHCAEGFGRSGTFVAAHSLAKEFHDSTCALTPKKTIVNLPERVLLLRTQRPKLISTTGQYKTVYESIRRSFRLHSRSRKS